MQTPKRSRAFPPNPATRAAHRRQTGLQILLPVAASAVGVLALAVLVSLGGSGDVSRWSSISLIFLILPTALVGLIALVLLALGIFLLSRALSGLPGAAHLLQVLFASLSLRVRDFADRLAAPPIAARSARAGWRAFWEALRSQAGDLFKPQSRNAHPGGRME